MFRINIIRMWQIKKYFAPSIINILFDLSSLFQKDLNHIAGGYLVILLFIL